MKITDEMVERATEAIKDRARRGAIKYTNGKITVMDIDIARAALTAALGDVEPLEDAIRPLGTMIEVEVTVYEDPRLSIDASLIDLWQVTANNPFPDPLGTGTGPTVDAAIREAVANAKGGE